MAPSFSIKGKTSIAEEEHAQSETEKGEDVVYIKGIGDDREMVEGILVVHKI